MTYIFNCLLTCAHNQSSNYEFILFNFDFCGQSAVYFHCMKKENKTLIVFQVKATVVKTDLGRFTQCKNYVAISEQES